GVSPVPAGSVGGDPADDPGGPGRFDEVGRLEVAQAVVVGVALDVSGAAGGAHRAAELLRDRAFDREVAHRATAVVVVADEGVFDRRRGGVDVEVFEPFFAGAAVTAAVCLLRARVVDANEVVGDQAEHPGAGRRAAVAAAEVAANDHVVLGGDGQLSG